MLLARLRGTLPAEAYHLIKEYNLFALPVVDSKGILLGIVTVDDLIDVHRTAPLLSNTTGQYLLQDAQRFINLTFADD